MLFRRYIHVFRSSFRRTHPGLLHSGNERGRQTRASPAELGLVRAGHRRGSGANARRQERQGAPNIASAGLCAPVRRVGAARPSQARGPSDACQACRGHSGAIHADRRRYRGTEDGVRPRHAHGRFGFRSEAAHRGRYCKSRLRRAGAWQKSRPRALERRCRVGGGRGIAAGIWQKSRPIWRGARRPLGKNIWRKTVMSSAVAKATVKVRLIGTARSSEAFALRDFLQRSVVEFDWIEFGADDRTDHELRLDDAEIQRLPIVQLPDGVRLYAPSVRELAEHLGWVTQPRRREYDVSIYGAGPAGLSAAVYAASEGLHAVVIERHAVGGQAGSSSLIENYMGFPNGISGAELAERARQQAVRFGIEILLLREGVQASFVDGKIVACLADGTKMVAKT